MDSELFNFLTTQGIFALLFGYLLLYILKQNQIREENYQKIIQQLNEVLPTIKNDLEGIKKPLKFRDFFRLLTKCQQSESRY